MRSVVIPAKRWTGACPDLGAIGLLLAVSLVVRVRHLPRPFHGDELITFSNMVLGRDFGGIIFGAFDSNNHILNSLIMKAVHLCAGEVPALIRLPNLVFSLLTVVFLYVVCSREFGRVAAFGAALLLSLHPAVVLYSVSGRGYAGMVFFTLISSFWFLRLVRSFSWNRLLGCALAGLLAGLFHLFAVVVLIAQGLLVVLVVARPAKGSTETLSARTARAGPAILGPVIAFALIVSVYLPSLLNSAVGSSGYSFQTAFPVALTNYMGGWAYRTDPDVVSILLLAVGLIGFLGLGKNRILRLYSVILFLSPVALWALSWVAPVFTLHPRFFAFLLPFYCFLLIAGLKHAVRAVAGGRDDRSRLPLAISGLACVCALFVAAVFVDRTKVPHRTALVRAQQAVGKFVDNSPDAWFLTNDTGFVRVRLRQEANMDRILPALGVKHIREFTDREPSGAIYFIYVPQKRYSKSDLIHYRGKVPPEVIYQRDERLRNYLTRNMNLELDLAPKLQIYALKVRE